MKKNALYPFYGSDYEHFNRLNLLHLKYNESDYYVDIKDVNRLLHSIISHHRNFVSSCLQYLNNERFLDARKELLLKSNVCRPNVFAFKSDEDFTLKKVKT